MYYYDQAGNLVRTVPPEGLHLLDASLQQQIWDARDKVVGTCTYNGPLSAANKDTLLGRLSAALQAGNTSAMECWLYNPAMDNNQLLATTSGNKYLFNTCISGRYLYMSIYTIAPAVDGSTVDFAISKHLVADLQSVFPMRQWTHVVLQGQGLNNSNLSVYVNGVLCPLSTAAPAGGCGWTLTNTSSGVIYPENLSTLKHLRFYKRLLSSAEIAANAVEPCLGLSPAYDSVLNSSLSYWGRYNLPAGGSGGSTSEMQVSPVYPAHTLATSYGYQSLNGITQQRTPDAGVSTYWYDRLGRLVSSQNAEQLTPVNGGATGRYSYTKYDAQGRVIEVGEKSGASLASSEVFMSAPETFLASGSDAQITRTFYDEAYAAAGLNQENLRKRVAATTYQDAGTTPAQATYYSYDQIGNVKTLWQQVQDLGVKKIDYQYDLVSGKVNKVRYQHGAADRFFYTYQYDAENRLIKAGTGIDSASADGWEVLNAKTDAAYRYYLHGPLARMELGDVELVQGVDYAYTLQGWLKGVNGHYLADSGSISLAASASRDMGLDGNIGYKRAGIARDAYAYSLDYYAGDYEAIKDTGAFPLKWSAQAGDVMGRNLYNGNISRSTLALSKINGGAPVGYSYRYDQLNRLTAMRQHGLSNGATSWNMVSVGNAYKEDISYDGNGNILRYTRYGSGAGGKQLQMDSLHYVYNRDGQGYLSSNKLTQVLDSIAGDPYTEDISSQGVNNYIYDNIGNLITNVRDSVTNIKWTVYGKISGITKGDGSSLEYRYDAGGNRVYKGYSHGGVVDKTWYVRDATGNVLAVYGNVSGGSDKYWKEQHLYGSSRLGMWEPGVLLGSDVDTVWNKVGLKRFELVNHLGNVLVTVSDKAVAAGGGYIPEVLSAGDYYAFGMGMVDRRWSLSGYRYGFNGKENDNEVKGEGNEQDYGMRVYDPRVGRFLSVDPLTNQFPHYTPYQFSGNTPIQAVDLDGSEERHYLLLFNKSGKPYLKMTSEEKVKLHSLFGFTWTTPIHAERADVNYNGTHYYIGYAGVKGAGNQDKIGDFHDWAKSPDPSLLPKLFNDEANSHWAAGTNAANGLMLSMWTYGNFLPLNTAKVPSAKTDYANHGSEYIDDALRSEPIDYGYASSSKRADHAMRHLIDQGVLPGTPNSKIARNAWSSLVKNVMSSPATTFDYFLQGAQTTGYYKKIGGQDVVLFVAKEAMGTVKAGQVIGGWVPSQALNPDIMAIINAPYVQSHVQSHSQSQSH